MRQNSSVPDCSNRPRQRFYNNLGLIKMNLMPASSSGDVDAIGAKKIETRRCFVMGMKLGLWRRRFARYHCDRK